MTSILVDKSTDHDKPHFDLFFFTTISTSKFFFFRARGKLTRAAWYGLLSTIAN